MKKVRFFSLLLICALLCSLCCAPALAEAKAPEIEAKAALLLDRDTGEILFERKADQKMYPASLTKIMTALLVFEAVDRGEFSLSDAVTATPAAFIGLDELGSTSGLEIGETLTIEQLLACMLINSANEAAGILAIAVDGTVSDFVRHMNEKATELGCENTHFANPSGLHNAEHYTTCRDLYAITRAAMEYPTFMTLCNSKRYEVPATNLHSARTLHSTNYLISNWRALGYLYSGAQGIKTGSTTEAGKCLISTAVRGDRSLFGIVLNSPNTIVREENGKFVQRVGSFIDMSALFDYGFDNFTRCTLAKKNDALAEANVALSRETNYVALQTTEDVERLLPNELTPEKLTRTVSLTEETFLAPIERGAEMGTLIFSSGDTVYAEIPLIAMNDVSASFILTVHYRITRFFSNTVVQIICLALLLFAVFLFITRHGRRRNRHHGTPQKGARGYRGKGRTRRHY